MAIENVENGSKNAGNPQGSIWMQNILCGTSPYML